MCAGKSDREKKKSLLNFVKVLTAWTDSDSGLILYDWCHFMRLQWRCIFQLPSSAPYIDILPDMFGFLCVRQWWYRWTLASTYLNMHIARHIRSGRISFGDPTLTQIYKVYKAITYRAERFSLLLYWSIEQNFSLEHQMAQTGLFLSWRRWSVWLLPQRWPLAWLA